MRQTLLNIDENTIYIYNTIFNFSSFYEIHYFRNHNWFIYFIFSLFYMDFIQK